MIEPNGYAQERRPAIVIVGAGAAGFMAAIFAARGPHPVLLLEGSRRPGQKILISGGGRCNVLPSQAAPTDFVTGGSPHTLRKIFSSWPLPQVRRFFEEDLRVPLCLEPGSGKLFPVAGRARVILDALLATAGQAGVQLRTGARAARLERHDHWWVALETGEMIPAQRVVLATGGLSVPATGSDGTGLRLARALGHTILPTYPALVPLTGDRAAHRGLSGVSVPVTLRAPLPGSRRTFESRGSFLFTHRGYSGPAVLNISHMITRATARGGPPPPIWVQWTEVGTEGWDTLLRESRGSLASLLRGQLPDRLAGQLILEAGLATTNLAQLTGAERARMADVLGHWPLPCTGSEGYRTAEVTGGGVALGEIDPATMESRVAPGLYLCGEMLDAFGPIGGYNFLWAWVTGRLAGLACAETRQGVST
jgi:hypothetical protein